MDAANIILTALGTALAAGGQAALSDTAKEVFEYLKKRIMQAFSGQQKALTILNEYEQDPDTWEKPFKNALVKAGLPQDGATVDAAQRLLNLVEQQTAMGSHIQHVQHTGTGYGSVYGNNYGPINVSPGQDKIADGKVALKRGREALLRGEYDLARRHLEHASYLLPEDDLPTEIAQAKFLQALALLKSKRPYSTAYQTIRLIVEILQGAIALHPCRSYLYSLALIKQDYARNGFPRFNNEAQELIHRMELISPSTQDRENMELFASCQPHLVRHA